MPRWYRGGPGSTPGRTSAGVRSASGLGGWSNGTTPGLHPGDRGSTPRPVHCRKTERAAGPAERRRPRVPEIGVRLPGGPLSEVWGPWSSGTTPPWRGGDPGSTPGGSTPVPRTSAGRGRKVAGYGWPGLVASECAREGVRVRIPRLPLDAFDRQGRPPGRGLRLQPGRTGFESLRPCCMPDSHRTIPSECDGRHATLRRSQTGFDSRRGDSPRVCRAHGGLRSRRAGSDSRAGYSRSTRSDRSSGCGGAHATLRRS